MDKKIDGFENYSIDEFGVVKNLKTGRTLKPHLHSRGYFDIGLPCKDGKCKKFLIHRLVAKTFLPFYNENLQINHIDNNRQNNHISNLECISGIENIQKSFNRGKVRNISKLKIVEVYKVKKWESVDDFFEALMKY